MDQLHMHFTQAIHNTVFQVVLGYVELCAGNADTKFQKMQYKDLCTVRYVLICPTDRPLVDVCMKIKCFFQFKVQYNATSNVLKGHAAGCTRKPTMTYIIPLAFLMPCSQPWMAHFMGKGFY